MDRLGLMDTCVVEMGSGDTGFLKIGSVIQKFIGVDKQTMQVE
jgi:hypothetical protein